MGRNKRRRNRKIRMSYEKYLEIKGDELTVEAMELHIKAERLQLKMLEEMVKAGKPRKTLIPWVV